MHVLIVLTIPKNIQQWFYHFHNKTPANIDIAMEIQKLFDDMACPAAPKPRAKQLVQFYSKDFGM